VVSVFHEAVAIIVHRTRITLAKTLSCIERDVSYHIPFFGHYSVFVSVFAFFNYIFSVQWMF